MSLPDPWAIRCFLLASMSSGFARSEGVMDCIIHSTFLNEESSRNHAHEIFEIAHFFELLDLT